MYCKTWVVVVDNMKKNVDWTSTYMQFLPIQYTLLILLLFL